MLIWKVKIGHLSHRYWSDYIVAGNTIGSVSKLAISRARKDGAEKPSVIGIDLIGEAINVVKKD